MSDDEIAAVAGCDLLNEAPEIRNWLLDVEKGKELIVGGTGYKSPHASIPNIGTTHATLTGNKSPHASTHAPAPLNIRTRPSHMPPLTPFSPCSLVPVCSLRLPGR